MLGDFIFESYNITEDLNFADAYEKSREFSLGNVPGNPLHVFLINLWRNAIKPALESPNVGCLLSNNGIVFFNRKDKNGISEEDFKQIESQFNSYGIKLVIKRQQKNRKEIVCDMLISEEDLKKIAQDTNANYHIVVLGPNNVEVHGKIPYRKKQELEHKYGKDNITYYK